MNVVTFSRRKKKKNHIIALTKEGFEPQQTRFVF